MVVLLTTLAIHTPQEFSAFPTILLTTTLTRLVLNVATAKATAGNSFYGVAIGMTVMTGAVVVGSISGGAFNPAVGLGVFVMGLETVKQFGLYVVACLAGGAVAAFTYKIVNGIE